MALSPWDNPLILTVREQAGVDEAAEGSSLRRSKVMKSERAFFIIFYALGCASAVLRRDAEAEHVRFSAHCPPIVDRSIKVPPP